MQDGEFAEPSYFTKRGTKWLAFSAGICDRNYRSMGKMPGNHASKKEEWSKERRKETNEIT